MIEVKVRIDMITLDGVEVIGTVSFPIQYAEEAAEAFRKAATACDDLAEQQRR